MSYILITSQDPIELANRTNHALKSGYIPSGGVGMTIVPIPQKISETQVTYQFKPVYAQAMFHPSGLVSAAKMLQAMISPPVRVKVKFPKRRRKK